MNTSQIIAKNVRELCKKNNVSITKLLNDCGFSKNFIKEISKNTPTSKRSESRR